MQRGLELQPRRLLGNKRRYRLVPESQRRLIIYLRYGSLTNFDHAVNKVSEIADYLRISRQTVYEMLKRFAQRGYQLDALRRSQPGERRFRMLDAEVQRYLLSPQTLQTWAHMTIAERTSTLAAIKGVRISPTTLQRFYAHHKVKYRTAKTIYNGAAVHRASLETARMRFATFLGNMVQQKKAIVYMDETTFNSFSI